MATKDYVEIAKKLSAEQGEIITPEYLEALDNRTTEEWEQSQPAVSNSQGVCKDCGNGTLNNELNPAFDYVYDERNDVDVLVCTACGSSHVEVL